MITIYVVEILIDSAEEYIGLAKIIRRFKLIEKLDDILKNVFYLIDNIDEVIIKATSLETGSNFYIYIVTFNRIVLEF